MDKTRQALKCKSKNYVLWRYPSTGDFLFATMHSFFSYIVAHCVNMAVSSRTLLQPFQTLLWVLCVFAMLKKATNNALYLA